MRLSPSADRTGLVLGNRYRLQAHLGSGVSASVYLADDPVLGRKVAVKILHDALADDERFLRRFRDEARAAAALNHPHVMAVHDWGEEPMSTLTGRRKVPFLVSEYLAGGTLRALLGAGSRLTPAQALRVGLEAARGLEYAHRHDLVHRDIKPANLLFDEEGRLRIADFGLARALAEAHWSEPAGSLAGTAKYASPEQARGKPLDGRSDVYSLALVLVESVTGEVPFLTDTTLGTLMARLETPLPVDEEVFGALAEPLGRAGQPDPAARPVAAELVSALSALVDSFGEPEPLRLPGAELGELGGPEDDITTAVRLPFDDGFGVAGEATDEITLRSAVPAGADAPMGRLGLRRRRLPGGPAPADGAGGDDTDMFVPVSADEDQTAVQPLPPLPPPPPADHRPGPGALPWGTAIAPAPARASRHGGPFGGILAGESSRWTALVVAAAVIAGAIIGVAAWYAFLRVPTYAMPVMKGRLPSEIPELRDPEIRWIVDQTDVYNDDRRMKGRILEQYPEQYTMVSRGDRIRITVSLGPTPVRVPTDILGRSASEASTALAKVGLGAKLERANHEEIAKDHVISFAAGTPQEVPRGDEVGLIVSDGPAPRTVPGGLEGRPAAEVITALTNLGLAPARSDVFSETVTAGMVIAVDPPPGSQVARGSPIAVQVSKGPDVVVVPDLAGASGMDAANALQSQGMQPVLQGSPFLPVSATSPPAGTQVRRGAQVVVVTGLGGTL